MARYSLIFLVLLMSIGANIDDGFLNRLGVDPDILTVGLLAFVITGLIVHRRLAVIILTVLMSIGANVSAGTAAQIGYDPDYLLAALVALVLLPFVLRQLEMPFM